MNRIHTISLTLLTLLAAAMPACVAPSPDGDDAQDDGAQDESVGAAPSAINAPLYSLQTSTYDVLFANGDPVDAADIHTCDMFTNGVIRSWQLKEKNAKDFRFSRHWCRDMLSNGTLGADNDSFTHFFHDGDGTLGMSSVPLDKLPVGVRFQADRVLTISGDTVYKISDVAMLHASAADVFAQKTGYTQAPYALGRTDDTYTLRCAAGRVMTGMGVHEKAFSPYDQSEITGVTIRCQRLLYQ